MHAKILPALTRCRLRGRGVSDAAANYVAQLFTHFIILTYLLTIGLKTLIARQLRTQYVEGIYRSKYYTVTLRSRLKVT